MQVRETKDPKLLKSLLALASQLVSGERGKTTRVVVDRVERVRNDPLSLVFKRNNKTLEVTAGEETQIVQRLYIPLVDPYAQPQRSGPNKAIGSVDPVSMLVHDGLQSCVRDGAFGRGIYFPSELRVRSTDIKVFRAVCCDVAIGKKIDSTSNGGMRIDSLCICCASLCVSVWGDVCSHFARSAVVIVCGIEWV